MKLYTWSGPNPAVVHAMLLERQARVEVVEVDLLTGDNRSEEFLRLNPAGLLPLLITDEGVPIGESLAICEYLDEVLPGDTLIGATPTERALTRMWMRRIDIGVVQPVSNGWRFAEGLSFCENIMHVIPQAADDLKQIAAESLAWINQVMGDNAYVCGARLTVADLLLYVFVEVADAFGQTVDPSLEWIAKWRARMTDHAGSLAKDHAAALARLSSR